jgi:hypothetical protein
MATPTTFSDYRHSSAALEKTELIVGKCANGIRAVQIHTILSSGTRRFSTSGRWRERRPATIPFAPSPTINSVRYIAGELTLPSPRIVAVQLMIHF